jgi:hypothetical protein
MIDKEFLDILCCPVCRNDLELKPESSELRCKGCGRRYPIKDDIPMLLPEQGKL